MKFGKVEELKYIIGYIQAVDTTYDLELDIEEAIIPNRDIDNRPKGFHSFGKIKLVGKAEAPSFFDIQINYFYKDKKNNKNLTSDFLYKKQYIEACEFLKKFYKHNSVITDYLDNEIKKIKS